MKKTVKNTEKRIVNFLRNRKSSKTRVIAKALGMNKNEKEYKMVANTLLKLHSLNVLSKVKTGIYSIKDKRRLVGEQKLENLAKARTVKLANRNTMPITNLMYFDPFKKQDQKHDPVNRPSHYTDGKIEVIEYIEDKNLNFNLGNTVKYISRAGKKGADTKLQDLKKAQWYLNREINKYKTNTNE